MHRADEVKRIREPGADYEIRIVGDRRMPLRDFYHALLERPWWVSIAAISGAFLFANVIFGLAYLIVGGVAHARPESFRDAFFFSVQTMGTVGYGAMFPDSTGANLVVTTEAITGLTLTALATGLVFAKFSRSTARLIFTEKATIAPLNGVPTLSLRLGNERGNQIVDAQLKVVLVRTEQTSEGKLFYRMLDLPLTRQRALSLSRSWNALHVIDRESPLFGETPASLAAKEVELQVQVIGLDDATMQMVHGGHRYFARDILWGHRLADVLSETPDGHLLLDLRKFHEVEPTEPSAEFPYP
ncbi:MAG TPA: ion channel [Polyangia bacterium]|nr:ion channel [Polyangia bacterium]